MSTGTATVQATGPTRLLVHLARPSTTDTASAPDPQQDRGDVDHLVRADIAGILGHADAASVPLPHPFRDLGFDSLAAVELRNRLNAHTGIAFPPALIFDHPTVTELVDLVDERLRESEEDAGSSELDRIGALIHDCPDKTRQVLRERLASLIGEIDGLSTQDNSGSAEILEEADDDELFAYINNELNN